MFKKYESLLQKILFRSRDIESLNSLRFAATKNYHEFKQVKFHKTGPLRANFQLHRNTLSRNKQVACFVNLGLGQFCLFTQIQQEVWRSHFKHRLVNHSQRWTMQPAYLIWQKWSIHWWCITRCQHGHRAALPLRCSTSLWSGCCLSFRELANQRS